MKKLLFILAVCYVLINAVFPELKNVADGMVHDIIIIAVLIYACYIALAETVRHSDGSALLIGTLALNAFAINEIYLFAYRYLLKANIADITVADFSRSCAYLFLISAIVLLVRFPKKIEKPLNTAIGFVSGMATLLIIYDIAANNGASLHYFKHLIVTICFSLAVFLLIQSFKIESLNRAWGFALSVMAMCVIDTLYRSIYIFNIPAPYLQNVVISLFSLIYLSIALSLLKLKNASREALQNG